MSKLINKPQKHENIFQSVKVICWTDLGKRIGQIKLYSFEYCFTTIILAIEKAKKSLKQLFANLNIKLTVIAQNDQGTFLFPFSYHSTDKYHQPIIFSV